MSAFLIVYQLIPQVAKRILQVYIEKHIETNVMSFISIYFGSQFREPKLPNLGLQSRTLVDSIQMALLISSFACRSQHI